MRNQHHPIPAVAAFIREGERILMIRRGKAPAQGLWCVPGGSIELGETAAGAMVREVEEETGLVVRPLPHGEGRPLHYVDAIYPDPQGRGYLFHYLILYLAGEVIGGEMRPGDDALEVGFFTLDELSSMEVEPRTMEIIRTICHREGSEAAGPG